MKTLKIKFLGLSLIVLFSLQASAQNEAANSKYHFGFKGGVNLAVQSDIASYFENETIRTGLSVGVFANRAMTSNLDLQAELNYSQKGDKSATTVLKYDYIEIPVLLKYSLGESDLSALKININAGPYASFLINAESTTNDIDTDMSDSTEDFEFGMVAGLGFKYPVANNNLVLDIRLGLGLTPYDKNDSDPNNKYFGITLGYEF